MSEHLGELSGEGDSLVYLNKWERIVYYVDELCTEVNSGGFNGYLYYNELYFENVYNALESINALGVVQILNTIGEKFPKKRIPKNEESLQNTIDFMEEKGIDFEVEEELLYKEISFVCLRPDGAYESPSTIGIMCKRASKR